MATASKDCVNYTKTDRHGKNGLKTRFTFKPPQLEVVTYATA